MVDLESKFVKWAEVLSDIISFTFSQEALHLISYIICERVHYAHVHYTIIYRYIIKQARDVVLLYNPLIFGLPKVCIVTTIFVAVN